MQNITIEEVGKIGYNAILNKYSDKIITRNNNLGENFSNKHRMRLFGKMVIQLQINNTKAVKRLIRKGAYVDREFFQPADEFKHGPTFWIKRRKLERILKFLEPQLIHNIVVFSGNATFKTSKINNVCHLEELIPSIEQHPEGALSLNRVQFCVGRLEYLRLELTRQTDVEHQAYLAQKFGR